MNGRVLAFVTLTVGCLAIGTASGVQSLPVTSSEHVVGSVSPMVELHDKFDHLWLAVAAALVFVMQGGFMCLEAGLTRPKNSINVAVKNLADFLLSVGAFWLVGFGVMFGTSAGGWIGTDHFMPDMQLTPWLASFFVFQAMFCGTAATIDSGAVAERTRFPVYLMLSFVTSAMIYPVIGHWVWNGIDQGAATGWLGKMGFLDFAGSTVVHCTGAWVALASVIVIGPRLGRFDEDGVPKKMTAHSLPLAILGVFLLMFGWFGFNCGSTLSVDPSIATVALNTVLAAAFGGVSAMVSTWLIDDARTPNPMTIANGVLGGLVAITAGCAYVSAPGAVVIGITSGLLVHVGAYVLVNKCQLDDVVDAIPVHGFCGVWGTLALAIFITPTHLAETGLTRAGLLQVQALGAIVTFAFVFPTMFLLLTTVKRFTTLRVDPADEEKGLNIAEHGVSTDVIDAVIGLESHRHQLDEAEPLPVESGSEVAPLVQQYNRVLDAFQSNTKELEAREASMRAVMDCALDAIITFDASGQLTEFNPAAERIFGHRRADVLGQSFAMTLLPDDSQDQFNATVARFHETGDSDALGRRFEITAQRADETPFPCEIALAGIADGATFQFSAFLQDLTNRKAQESKLRHAIAKAEAANEAKSRFLANMSHEIRTPLNGILGFAELMLDDVEPGRDERREYLHTIQSSGRHLLHLINDILDLSKIEAGQFEIEKVDCSPHERLAEVISLLRVQALEKNVSLDYQWSGPIPKTILTDGHRLRQMLMNLIGNAIKFTENGKVEVTARLLRPLNPETETTLAIEIADTGIGIPADKLTKIFDPFMQSDASVTRQFGGTGLGLAISRKLARVLGGDITVESELGRGSRFTITIPTGPVEEQELLSFPVGDVLPKPTPVAEPTPITEPTSAIPPTVAAAPTPVVAQSVVAPPVSSVPKPPASPTKTTTLAGRHVLVVDDGETNRKLIELVLRKVDIVVTTACNGREAIETINANAASPFDLVLMDMQMPVLDGYSAATELRGQGYSQPIIALTAHAMKGDREKCVDAGCSDYLTKPIESQKLIKTLKKYLVDESAAVSAPVPVSVPAPAANVTWEPAVISQVVASPFAASVATPAPPMPAPIVTASTVSAPTISAPTVPNVELDDEDLQEVAREFTAELPSLIAYIWVEFTAGHFERVIHKAHQIVGSAPTFGLDEFSAPAQALVDAAERQDTAMCQAALMKLLRLSGRLGQGVHA